MPMRRGMGLGTSRLDSQICIEPLSAGVSASMPRGRGGEWCLPALLPLERSLSAVL